VDEWVPQPLVDEPNDVDQFTLASVPVIHGANGLRVKLSPNGKTVCHILTPLILGTQSRYSRLDRNG
jgi:serine palmitoyltransferase